MDIETPDAWLLDWDGMWETRCTLCDFSEKSFDDKALIHRVKWHYLMVHEAHDG